MDKLLHYYSANDVVPALIMNMWIEDCAAIKSRQIDKKWCGCGTTMVAYGVDGGCKLKCVKKSKKIRGCKLKCVKKSKKIITLDTLFLL